MEINKQLFEDVLSGKLKGTFVLRNGETYYSDVLRRNYGGLKFTHPYVVWFKSYTPKGIFAMYDRGAFDIVNFTPDADMKENELTIEIPDGKIVDWDESKKQNKIVLKDKQLTYSDACRKLFVGYGWFPYPYCLQCVNASWWFHEKSRILSYKVLILFGIYAFRLRKRIKGDGIHLDSGYRRSTYCRIVRDGR